MQSSCPVIGIDVAKEFCFYAVLTPTGNEHLKPFKALNTEKGLNMVLKMAEEVTQAFACKPAIVLESTGHYSNRLVYFFLKNNFEVHLVNPLQSNSIRKSTIRKVKNDKVDAKAIARLYFLHDLRQVQHDDTYFQDLKVLTRTASQLGIQRVKTIHQLTAAIEQSMPNYIKIFSRITSKTSLAILTEYTSPQLLLKAPKDEIVKLIKTSARASLDYALKKYHKLMKMAKESLSIGVTLDAYSCVIKLHAEQLCYLDKQLKTIDEQIAKIAVAIPEIELLSTIPGIGPKLAPIIAAEIGNINRFKNAKQLIGYCGVDPSVNQSGNFVGSRNKMTKRGSPYIRRALYIAACVSVRKGPEGKYTNKVIHDFYQKKIKTKPKKQALGAVMSKLLKIIHSVLKNQRPFVMITPEQQVKMYKAKLKLIA